MASVSTTIPQAVEKLTRMQAGLRAAQQVALQRSAEQGALILADEVRARTPVGTSTVGDHLRDTTESSVVQQGNSAALITVRQTKTIPIKGEQVPLALVLRKGAKPPANLIVPVVKKALYWQGIEGGHPVRSSHGREKPQPPNPYQQEAQAAAMPAVLAVTRRTTYATLQAAIREATA